MSHCIVMHMRSTYFLFYKLHTFCFHVRSCMILAFSSTKQKQKGKHENSWCILGCIYSVPWANHVGIINPFPFCMSHCIVMHMRSTYFLFYKLHTFCFHVRSCMILAFSSTKQKQKGKHENSWCILGCIYSVPWANHVGIINPFLKKKTHNNKTK